MRISRAHDSPRARFALALAGAAALSALVLPLRHARGAFAKQLGLFSYVDQWAAANRYNTRYYHDTFLDQYATIWTLFPLLAVLALYRNGRAASFCLVPFVVAFVVHSLAAWKAERYLFSVDADVLRGRRDRRRGGQPAGCGRPSRVRSTGSPDLALTTRPRARTPRCSSRLCRGVRRVRQWRHVVRDQDDARERRELAARGTVSRPARLGARRTRCSQAELDSADVVISTSELKSLYYLHRADVLLSVDYLGDPRHPGPEFTMFRKLARPVMSTTQSLDQLRACYSTGLIVAEHGQWRAPWSVQSSVADYIETALDPVHLVRRRG